MRQNLRSVIRSSQSFCGVTIEPNQGSSYCRCEYTIAKIILEHPCHFCWYWMNILGACFWFHNILGPCMILSDFLFTKQFFLSSFFVSLKMWELIPSMFLIKITKSLLKTFGISYVNFLHLTLLITMWWQLERLQSDIILYNGGLGILLYYFALY